MSCSLLGCVCLCKTMYKHIVKRTLVSSNLLPLRLTQETLFDIPKRDMCVCVFLCLSCVCLYVCVCSERERSVCVCVSVSYERGCDGIFEGVQVGVCVCV